MKKFFCAVMATMTMLTASSPCLTAAAAEANKNNAQSISQQVAEMSKDYNGEYEEEMKKTGSDSIAIDNRLIVKTDKKVTAPMMRKMQLPNTKNKGSLSKMTLYTDVIAAQV